MDKKNPSACDLFVNSYGVAINLNAFHGVTFREVDYAGKKVGYEIAVSDLKMKVDFCLGFTKDKTHAQRSIEQIAEGVRHWKECDLYKQEDIMPKETD